MNIDRRKRLSRVLMDIRISLDLMQEIIDDEQEAYENMPDGLKQGDRGQEMQDGIDTLESVYGAIDQAVDEAEELCS